MYQHPNHPPPTLQNNPLELTNTALWIYTVAFEELRRGLAVQCKDRAQLLGALWQQYTGLVETRAGLVQEDALAAAKREAEVARQRVEAMQGKLTYVCVCWGVWGGGNVQVWVSGDTGV